MCIATRWRLQSTSGSAPITTTHDDDNAKKITVIIPSIISFGTGKAQVKTRSIELQVHKAQHANYKDFLITNWPHEFPGEFMPNGLHKVMPGEVYSQHIRRQNHFLQSVHQGIEPTKLTSSIGKWFIITTKNNSEEVVQHFDRIIVYAYNNKHNEYSIPLNFRIDDNSVPHRTRLTHAPTNTFRSYAEALTKADSDRWHEQKTARP